MWCVVNELWMFDTLYQKLQNTLEPSLKFPLISCLKPCANILDPCNINDHNLQALKELKVIRQNQQQSFSMIVVCSGKLCLEIQELNNIANIFKVPTYRHTHIHKTRERKRERSKKTSLFQPFFSLVQIRVKVLFRVFPVKTGHHIYLYDSAKWN